MSFISKFISITYIFEKLNKNKNVHLNNFFYNELSQKFHILSCYDEHATIIKNSMGHNLAIIIMQNMFFIGLYRINIDVIHLFVLFEH
jgi:hypothetical protein